MQSKINKLSVLKVILIFLILVSGFTLTTNWIGYDTFSLRNSGLFAIEVIGRVLQIGLLVGISIISYYKKPSNKQVFNFWNISFMMSIVLYAIQIGGVIKEFEVSQLIFAFLPNLTLSNDFITTFLLIMVLAQPVKRGLDRLTLRKVLTLILVIIVLLGGVTFLNFSHHYSIIDTILKSNLTAGVLILIIVYTSLRLIEKKELQTLKKGMIVSNVFLSLEIFILFIMTQTGYFNLVKQVFLSAGVPIVLLNLTVLGVIGIKRIGSIDLHNFYLPFIAATIAFNYGFMTTIGTTWGKILQLVTGRDILLRLLLVPVILMILTYVVNSFFKQLRLSSEALILIPKYHLMWGLIYVFILHGLFMSTNSIDVHANLVAVTMGRPWMMILDVIILLAMYLLWTALINRPIIANFTFILITGSFALANYLKVIARNEPILPSEISNIKILPVLIQMVDIKFVIGAIIGVILLLLAMFIINHKIKINKFFKWPARISIIVTSVLFLIGTTYSITGATAVIANKTEVKRQDIQVLSKMNYKPALFLPLTQFRTNGEFVAFMSLMSTEVMEKPSDYSKEAMISIQKKYTKLANNINKKRKNDVGDQTVIYILSESLANPNRMPGVKLSTNPLPNLEKIKASNSSGLMNSLGYGGGTANIEYESLTGLSMNNFAATMTTPYIYLVPRMDFTPTIMDAFKYKTAIHPYLPDTYERGKVFEKFGFQHFYSTTGKDKVKYQNKKGNSWFIDDDSAFKEVLKQLKKQEDGQFIQLTTIQNHTPFNKKYINQIPTKSKLTDNSMLETYVQGMRYTDDALKDFMNEIDKMDRKVTIVFYGDHLPGFYNYKKGYQLPSNFDTLSHQTDYFIYSNFESEKIGPTDVVDPVFFTPMTLAKTNSKISPYNALLTQVWQKTPAGERQRYMIGSKEVTYDKLTKSQKEILHDYRLIQYDITAGKKYTLEHNKNFYKMP